MVDNLTNSQANIEQVKAKVIPHNASDCLTIEDIRKIAILKYTSISGFGRKLGVTQCMASRLLSGSYVPLTAESIKKIADVLAIDAVVLSQVYERCKR